MDMVIAATRVRLLARRIGPSSADGEDAKRGGEPADERAARWPGRADAGLRPTRGPFGEVPWWERPPPGGDAPMWDAVKRLQRRRLQLGLKVTHLARRMARLGHPISRETLSRVLNGKQPTSWATVAVMAEALSADVPEMPDEH